MGVWEDCDAVPSSEDGRFETQFYTAVYDGTQYYMMHPKGDVPSGAKGWPGVIFMHALNLGWEWYQPQAARWASHGIAVVFPFIKSQTQDDNVPDKVFETDGTHLVKAMDFMKNAKTT